MKSNYYDHLTIEKKWQEYWKKHKTFEVKVDEQRKKYYILDMFPYPSGAGLHVGHVTGYSATDVLSRYKRQKGFNVLHPMGWDSFGLPAEQYAMRTGTHPMVTTEKNIANYKRQLQSLGLSYDWSREVKTSDPGYYKWTQWIFTKLYEKGLAYQDEVSVNYCPHLGTVLANEEVENGKSVEGGYAVERRPLKQWILRITEYAKRLKDDLDLLDWPDSLKKLQRNWIGESRGLEIEYTVEGIDTKIKCFTTRPDTIFGVNFFILAPEHPLVMDITTDEETIAVSEYIEKVKNKSELQRMDLSKEKTGVSTGAFAINPITKERIPIWVADYVLISYGTGAVMGVAGHDERDREFSKQFSIPFREVIDKDGSYINSSTMDFSLQGLSKKAAIDNVCKRLEELSCGRQCVQYKLRDWLFSRQRYWGEPFPLYTYEDGTRRILRVDELPLEPPSIEDYAPTGDGKSPLSKVKKWVEVVDNDNGKKVFRETDTMPQWAGSCWYYLRFCDPRNSKEAWSKESEKYWLPVDMYVGGVEHAVLHLLYARFWHKVLYDCGEVSTLEPFKTLRNQGLVTAYAYRLEKGGYVAPEDVEKRDDAHYEKKTGLKVEKLLEKMSKSKLNGVSPDEIIEEYGADSLRLYELFMSPFDKEKLWNTDAVIGCRRLLNRIFEMMHSEKVTESESEEANQLIHRLIKGVEQDIEALMFNTAIAKIMEFMNHFSILPSYPKSCLKILCQLLNPFTPHFAEEMWELLGGRATICDEPFPTYDAKYLVDNEVMIVFQVNGKVRGKELFQRSVGQEEVEKKARSDETMKKYISGVEIRRIIFVKDKLLNIVI